MPDLRIQTLRSGGLVTTYHCPSRCAHCLYRAGPHRRVAYIDADTTERVFRRVRELGCRSVHIGGGEPFVDVDGLYRVLEQAQSLGVDIDYVETNASWYTDPEEARRVLTRLRGAGLATLLVSISPFHNAHIPFSQVKGVLNACRAAGVTPFPWGMELYADLDAFDDQATHTLQEYEKTHGPNYLHRIPARYWIHLGGRSLETFGRVHERRDHGDILAAERRGCGELLRTEHFHADLHGNYVPGLCAGLSIAFEDVGHPLPARRYPLLSRLFAEGIGGLYTWSREEHGFEPRRRGYLSKCDLCEDIRRHLVRSCDVDSPELQPTNFYLDCES